MQIFGCKRNLPIIITFLFFLSFEIELCSCAVYYFEIVSPETLRYSFEVWSAKDFGTKFTSFFNRIPLVLTNPIESCGPLENEENVKQSVVLTERGQCSFMSKTYYAQNAGALAVIITDSKSSDDIMIEMIKDDTNRRINIPALYLPGRDGRRLRHHLLYESTPIFIKIPLNLTMAPLHTVKKPPWNLW